VSAVPSMGGCKGLFGDCYHGGGGGTRLRASGCPVVPGNVLQTAANACVPPVPSGCAAVSAKYALLHCLDGLHQSALYRAVRQVQPSTATIASMVLSAAAR
jgi:hypothetical protein